MISSNAPQFNRPPQILPIIVLSQFAGTSLWFAVNAILPDLQHDWNLPADTVGNMTSAIQLGFITGTLLFAFLNIADRFSPRKIFLICSLAGSVGNLLIYGIAHELTALLFLRFLTGIALAGIYPVGMKIAAGWYKDGLGNALGFLVGALVLGTSFPHFLRSFESDVHWETVIVTISAISAAGGVLMWFFVPDGPYLTQGTSFNPKALAVIFQSRDLRAAVFGYFGHMWELYTFYAFVPFMLLAYQTMHPEVNVNVSFWSFCIIAAGSFGCAAGGVISQRAGSARVAFFQLFGSGLLCLFSPLLFHSPTPAFFTLFISWGALVVGDSPQFSALIARYAPKELVGSALTIGNSIGFSITIVSIQTISYLTKFVHPEYLFMFLAVGPLVGLVSISPLLKNKINHE
jgi:predicted MFS family arabinose efflux permease